MEGFWPEGLKGSEGRRGALGPVGLEYFLEDLGSGSGFHFRVSVSRARFREAGGAASRARARQLFEQLHGASTLGTENGLGLRLKLGVS